MSNPAEIEQAAAVLKLLADTTRLRILNELAAGECSVTDLAARLQRPVPAISQHLAKLRTGGLVAVRREGTTSWYSPINEHVEAIVGAVLLQAEHLMYPTPPHHQE